MGSYIYMSQPPYQHKHIVSPTQHHYCHQHNTTYAHNIASHSHTQYQWYHIYMSQPPYKYSVTDTTSLLSPTQYHSHTQCRESLTHTISQILYIHRHNISVVTQYHSRTPMSPVNTPTILRTQCYYRVATRTQYYWYHIYMLQPPYQHIVSPPQCEVSFAEYHHFYRDLLQKRPIIPSQTHYHRLRHICNVDKV